MKDRAGRRLSREILGLLGITVLLSFVLLQVLSISALGIIESVLFSQNVTLSDAQYAALDDWVFNLSLLVSVSFFVILFLFLLGERLSYIREILKGIDALQKGQEDYLVPLEGRNELTQLAEAVNYLSQTQRQVRQRERLLSQEKEQFIRGLSHDIRTPLTSILSYTELLEGEHTLSQEEQAGYLGLIRRKASQIKDMTDLLLDGSKRNPEHFENARLLMEQLAAEFEETLEDTFPVRTDLSGCPEFPGAFDVQELRRVFDNLISNVQKYADPDSPVTLSLSLKDRCLRIRQENAVLRRTEPAEGYRLGLRSIQRIAQNYAGEVTTRQEEGRFSLSLTLSEF